MAVRDWRWLTDAQPVSVLRWLRLPWGRALVFPAAVLAVHQLWYLLAYGSRAGSELAAHGDHYVAAAALLATAPVALSLGLGVRKLLAARRGDGNLTFAAVPVWLVWLGTTAALLAGFCALEGLEAVFEAHHAGGVLGIFGQGGWWALPAAACVAALTTLLARGGRALLVIASRGQRARLVRVGRTWRPRVLPGSTPPAPMATCAAGRAPPSASAA